MRRSTLPPANMTVLEGCLWMSLQRWTVLTKSLHLIMVPFSVRILYVLQNHFYFKLHIWCAKQKLSLFYQISSLLQLFRSPLMLSSVMKLGGWYPSMSSFWALIFGIIITLILKYSSARTVMATQTPKMQYLHSIVYFTIYLLYFLLFCYVTICLLCCWPQERLYQTNVGCIKKYLLTKLGDGGTH